ncbi:WD repeat-containing protein 13-like isoform X2 [Asterias amurensis]|uniref:WD repeat-containing protein 13-like isoform X1 n=1 Tax=Asterias amurensis TaxID=7602 RepID=UPI003AB7E1A0
MAAVWQQVLALDARYNTYRAPNSPQCRTLYIRRRSQLLRETAKGGSDPQVRKQYLKLRNQLLIEKYGATLSDQRSLNQSSSVWSRNNSGRGSKGNLESLDDSYVDSRGHLDVRGHRRNLSRGSYKLDPFHLELSYGVMPTRNAEASRAMAGGKSIGENYAFAGMHHIFDQHRQAVTSVQFANEDKSRMACSSLDGTVSICQVLPSPATVVCTLKGHESGVTDFCWSQSNDQILSSSLDGTVRLWAISSASCVRTVQDPDKSPIRACRFQPLNNNMIVTGNNRGHVNVLNVSTGKAAKGGFGRLSGQVLCMEFDDNGSVLWAGDDKGTIFSFLFDLATGKLSKGKRIVVREGCPVTSICYRAWVSREARDPTVLVNCAIDSLCIYKVVTTDGGLRAKKTYPIKHKSALIRSTFCPLMSFREGACVVTGSEDMSVYFYDVERTSSKPCVNKLQGHSGPVLAVSFNYDESLLASCDSEGLVIVWKREQQKAR